MRAVVIGGGAPVWDELEQAESLCDFDLLIAINDAGAKYPGIVDYWVTLHPEKLGIWAKQRQENGFAPARHHVAHEDNTHAARRNAFPLSFMVPYTWPGSSGLFAVEVAIKKLGCEKIVLCGVPMTATPHFFDNVNWDAVAGFWDAWPIAYPHIKDKVRSMSGRTKELLGAPSRAWLE
ncbi:hypothetical protein SJ05684_c10600 [Sinorhizobium sojae CCBAU 05684]|uniref:Uncharacterized protein n=1 Tax=Sinorhizobium sojae CCBAU 05684 TaxID=716928 RepID=A0A249P9Z2_9HYPH|nr:hypothetical protein [Sinorhizobium sojae]ASY62517.1 hypothetical protein SJ05684_c10600 [Sinorhizobium sojae CCBAU 05684]